MPASTTTPKHDMEESWYRLSIRLRGTSGAQGNG
jgi:hypothetical protein